MRWTVHGERSLYESDWMQLRLADVELPGGDRFEHHLLRTPAQAAGVVVHDPDRGVLLLWRHRFITDAWGWEIPAGRIDDGEEATAAAAREVEEETGWRCKLGEHIGKNEYRDRHGRSKRVDWWLMEPIDGEFEPNDEVDEIRWEPIASVRDVLTHDDDYALIEQAGLA